MAGMFQIKEFKNGLTFEIQVIPRASRAEITGWQDGALKLKANLACVKLLSKVLELRRSQLEILAGEKSRKKVVLVKDISKKDLEEKISNIL